MPGMLCVILGALFVALSLPLLKRRVPMNHWYGFRFRQSFVSTENWYAINEYGAQRLLLWAAIILVIGVAALFPPLNANPGFQAIVPLLPLLMIIGMIEAYHFARQLPEEDQR